MILILLGAPGSGKGSVSEILKRNNNFNHISTGQIFREIFNQNTELSRRVKEIVNSGNLVDDETTSQILIENLKKFNYLNENIIIDGYPRNINQAIFLDKFFNDNKIENFKVIYFDISNETILERLSGRMVCPKCSSIYNKTLAKPKVLGICDLDGEKLVIREDDKPENIKKRLQIYHTETIPVLKFYEQFPNYVKINMENSINENVESILENV